MDTQIIDKVLSSTSTLPLKEKKTLQIKIQQEGHEALNRLPEYTGQKLNI